MGNSPGEGRHLTRGRGGCEKLVEKSSRDTKISVRKGRGGPARLKGRWWVMKMEKSELAYTERCSKTKGEEEDPVERGEPSAICIRHERLKRVRKIQASKGPREGPWSEREGRRKRIGKRSEHSDTWRPLARIPFGQKKECREKSNSKTRSPK